MADSAKIPYFDESQSFAHIYSALLIEARQIDVRAERQADTCIHCGRVQSEHLLDKRCNVYTTSREFYSVEGKRRATISKLLGLMEDMRMHNQ